MTTLEKETISGEALVAAVNLVNDYRRKVGLEPIDDLPKGKPGDVRRCILARAFNFDCRVSPYGNPENDDEIFGSYGGGIYFSRENEKQARLLGQLLGTEVFDHGGKTYLYVDLPANLAKIARYFDYGKLPQYEEKE